MQGIRRARRRGLHLRHYFWDMFALRSHMRAAEARSRAFGAGGRLREAE
jgi:hypothetical protein